MTSSQPVIAVLVPILEDIAQRRRTLDDLEAKVREASTLYVAAMAPVWPGARALSTAARAHAPRRPPAAARTAPPPAITRRSRGEPTGLDQAVATYLDRQRGPVTMAAVVAAMKSYPARVRAVLDQMAAAGTLVRTGTRNSLRLGRPAVMATENTEGD